MDLRRYLVLAIACLVITTSGCTDAPDQNDDTDEGEPVVDENETADPPQVTRGEGSVTASGGVLTFGTPGTAFQVGENATLIFAELEWDDPVNDLDLALSSPGAGETGTARNYDHTANGGSPGMPDSPHSLTLTGDDVEAGEWLMSASSNGAGANVEFRVVATVFYGETAVPDGYTAL